MSISSQITRITAARNKIRNKLVNLGLAESSATLDTLASAVDGIVNRGAPNASVTEGDSYSIEPGYYTGGTIAGVGGGGNYTLQAKSATPTKQVQQIAADPGYYGLSEVNVAAIPAAYQDVSSVSATAAHVLAGDLFVTSDGTLTTGEMVNNGAVQATIDGINVTSYTVPKGYHGGTGKVSLTADIENALAAI